jgi:hypothetical protein
MNPRQIEDSGNLANEVVGRNYLLKAKTIKQLPRLLLSCPIIVREPAQRTLFRASFEDYVNRGRSYIVLGAMSERCGFSMRRSSINRTHPKLWWRKPSFDRSRPACPGGSYL